MASIESSSKIRRRAKSLKMKGSNIFSRLYLKIKFPLNLKK